jgi:hypothetical protein
MVEPMLRRATELEARPTLPAAHCRLNPCSNAYRSSLYTRFPSLPHTHTHDGWLQDGPAIEKLLQCIAAAAVHANIVTGLLGHSLLSILPAKRFITMLRAVGEELNPGE